MPLGRVAARLALLLVPVGAWTDEASPPEFIEDDASVVTLRATVSGADGRPLDGFRLVVARYGVEPEVFRFRRAAGVLEARLHTHTTHAIAIAAAGHTPWFSVFTFTSGGTHDLGEVALKRERVLRGRVVDSATGTAIAGAGLKYAPPRGDSAAEGLERWVGSSTATGEDGGFRLRRLPGHGVRIEVWAPGYAGRSIALAAGTERLDIELGVGAVVEGSLVLPGGEPVDGSLTLAPDGARWDEVERQETSNGSFRFERLPPGSYTLRGRTDAGVVEPRALTVAGDERQVVELAVDPLGRLSGFVEGLTAGQSVRVSVRRADAGRSFVRAAASRMGNGPFELDGIADGNYVVEADAGDFSLERGVRMVGGAASVRFEFAEGSRLSGRVLAGERPLAGIFVEAVPVDGKLPSSGGRSDAEGRFAIDRLDDGDYLVRVRLGRRGTHRSYEVTVAGDTAFDVSLGPFGLSGKVLGERIPAGRHGLGGSSGFVNHVVQARLLAPGDQPMVFRDFVDSRGRYAFDGLEEGRYAVSHVSPFYATVHEVPVFGGSVSGVDFAPAPGEARPVRFVDAESGEALIPVRCEIKEGQWAGMALGDVEGWLPTTLTDTGMSCASAGYAPVSLRWDGGPLEVELEPVAGRMDGASPRQALE